MKKIIVCVIGAFFIYGCFASMPEKVDPQYLKEKTPEQEKKIESIELEIIKISEEKDKSAEDLKVTDLKIPVIKKEISQIEGQIALIKDQQKVYLETKENAKYEESKKELQKNEEQQKISELKLKYYKAKKEDQESTFKVKEMSLFAKNSEKSFEEAKIGRASQDKIMGPPPKDKDGKIQDKDRIQVSKHEDYYKSQLESLAKKQKDQEKTFQQMKAAEASLKAAGYTGEL